MNIDKIRARFAGTDHVAADMPAELAHVDAALITDLDVRDDLRNGREPFSRIMAAQQTVAAGGVLRIRAIFEPVPLYAALGRSGFSHWTNRLDHDDWEVWFYRGATTPPAPAETVRTDPAPLPAAGNTVTLDVRGLEPPEPMQQTLERLANLPPQTSLLQINSRVPHFLIPVLEERGFEYVLVSEEAGKITGLIRRKTGEDDHA